MSAIKSLSPAPPARAPRCAADYQYIGLQWSRECWCDNDYGSLGGGLENAACDADGDGAADCAQGVDGACGLMNAVYDTATSEYMGCYPDGTDPVGVTFEGDAYTTAEYGVHLDGRGAGVPQRVRTHVELLQGA